MEKKKRIPCLRILLIIQGHFNDLRTGKKTAKNYPTLSFYHLSTFAYISKLTPLEPAI